ncbi:MAG: macro domain-containing protein [Nitrososphaerales archaeon]
MVKVNKFSVELIKGDITELHTDAIVNAANSKLRHGAGVAWAIINKGGYVIQKESDKLHFCLVGNAVITTAGKLKAKYVIHAVGPVRGEGNEDAKLKSATLSALKLADKYKLRSIAFPAISTGAFRFPKDRCANVMLNAVADYAEETTGLEKVIFCLYDDETFEVFKDVLQQVTKTH